MSPRSSSTPSGHPQADEPPGSRRGRSRRTPPGSRAIRRSGWGPLPRPHLRRRHGTDDTAVRVVEGSPEPGPEVPAAPVPPPRTPPAWRRRSSANVAAGTGRETTGRLAAPQTGRRRRPGRRQHGWCPVGSGCRPRRCRRDRPGRSGRRLPRRPGLVRGDADPVQSGVQGGGGPVVEAAEAGSTACCPQARRTRLTIAARCPQGRRRSPSCP